MYLLKALSPEALAIQMVRIPWSCFQAVKLPRSYAGAAPRRKAGGARARKAAVYASLPGIRRLRIMVPAPYYLRVA